MLRWVAIAIGLLVLFLLLLYPQTHAEEHKHGNEVISGATGKFYESWRRPDNPNISCCSYLDCYSTRARMRNGKLQALHRESGEFIDIPPEKVEQNRDSPDGLNHICAGPGKNVFCFLAGGGS
jgi:hypothetical protein